MTKKRSPSQPRVSLATDSSQFGRVPSFHMPTGWSRWPILTTEKQTGSWTSQFLLLCLTTWFDWCKATKLLNNFILAQAVEWDNSDIVMWKRPYFLKTSSSPKQGTSAHYISNHPLVHKWVHNSDILQGLTLQLTSIYPCISQSRVLGIPPFWSQKISFPFFWVRIFLKNLFLILEFSFRYTMVTWKICPDLFLNSVFDPWISWGLFFGVIFRL